VSPLPLQARVPQIAEDLLRALNEPGEALAPAALAIARVEYPALDSEPYLHRLERMGEAAAGRLQRDSPVRIATLNAYLFEELGFSGNRDYDDPRNSLLNEVLDRRLGIPITLAVIYLEIGRRAGLRLEGVNFPGHFLVRAPAGAGAIDDQIIDPFHAGALLSEVDCRHLLRQHVGDEAAFDRGLLATATRQHIVVRMLVNLKRLYVRMRSFPQARAIADLLLAVDPSALGELRDRGLLAYHMEDFAAALKDLEAYLRLMPRGDAGDHEYDVEVASDEGDDGEQPVSESAQIWEHVKTLRRRVAGYN
jgi:regulator of sirC expression with transglutaminase-like and TPR domain